MEKEELLKKYCASEVEISFLTNYLNSFAETFRERYNKADLEGLYSAGAPVFLDKLEQIKRKVGVGSEHCDEIDEKEVTYLLHKKTIDKNFKQIFPAHIKIKLGAKDDNFFTSFSVLKFNQSIFFVEHCLVISIKILQPFYSEKEYQIIQKNNFLSLLDNLIEDLG